MNRTAPLAAVLMLAVAACSPGESPHADAVLDALDRYDTVEKVTGNDRSVTVHTTLTSDGAGEASGMCRVLDAADIDGLTHVTIESAGGNELAACGVF